MSVLARMARLLYPHEEIGDEVYFGVVSDFTGVIGDRAQYELLADGVASLNRQGGGDWLALSEAEQLATLRAIETSPFFAAVRSSVQTALYEHPAVWAMLGYPGPALPFGGYVDKGFDDIDWLPA